MKTSKTKIRFEASFQQLEIGFQKRWY